MIVVVGYLKLPPEKMDQVRQAVSTIVPETRKEPGCVYYAFAEDALEAGTLRIAEKWASWEALETHTTMPHSLAGGRH